jgi:hypothetical protein
VERLPAALVPEPSFVRNRDEVGANSEPPVAPDGLVHLKLETLPEDVDAIVPPLPPLAFEELQTAANAKTSTKTGTLKTFLIFPSLFIAIVNLAPE